MANSTTIPNEALYRDKIDVSSELYRIYSYSNGAKFRIDEPIRVYIMHNGGHRVVDSDGVTHRPSDNFVGISWKSKAGSPEFVA